MSIAVHTSAWAERAKTATAERDRVWIAYAPRPESSTPGKPPNHSPASGRYEVAIRGNVYARASADPPTVKRACHGARARTTQAGRAPTPAAHTPRNAPHSRTPTSAVSPVRP